MPDYIFEFEHVIARSYVAGKGVSSPIIRIPLFLKILHPPTLPANLSSQVFHINRNATVKLNSKFNKYYSCKTTT